MALIVETGAGLPTAESYASVAAYDAYHLLLGFVTLGTTPEKEADLRRGTIYVDLLGQGRWPGTRRTVDQALDWPRDSWGYDDGWIAAWDTIPNEIFRATCEAAKRAHVEDLLPDVSNNGMILSESVSLGPISKAVTYLGGKYPLKRYTLVDRILSVLFTSNSLASRA